MESKHFCTGFKDKILSDWNIVFRAIEADGGVHHGTYHRLKTYSMFFTWKPNFKLCLISFVKCFHSRSESGSFITSSSLPWLIVVLLFLGIAIYVIRFESSLFLLLFRDFCWHSSFDFQSFDTRAQITKIHEAVNSAQSAKSQLLDAPCRRWGTGLVLSKIIMNSRCWILRYMITIVHILSIQTWNLQGLMRQEQTDYLFAHTKVYVG